jgi:hypothetical protein
VALPKLKDLSQNVFAGITAATMLMAPMQAANAQQAQPVAVSQINVPMSDARNIGERSVRVVAAQETDRAMNIALFGVERDAWPRLRGAIQQGVANGCPVRAVFMGPTDVQPDLVIYAKGTRVTAEGIDPNTISPDTLTRLMCRITNEEYRRQLAARDPAAPSPN